MMYFIVFVMAAAVLAEPPISKSYLPPSPNGYPKGPQGFHGSQGLQGSQAFQGSQGLQGSQAFPGSQGLQGSQAFPGSQGLQGSQAFPGSQGLQGAQSFQGPQGATGPFPGAPEVVAARSFGQGRGQTLAQNGNDFARNSLDHATSSHPEGYDSAFGRNGETAEPASYNFGYMVNDYEGTEFGHHEERRGEGAQGEYHVVLPDGRKQTVSYEADERGFKPHISYQDSEYLARSGYDSNANARDFENGGHGNHGDGAHGHGSHGNGVHGRGSHGNDLHGNGINGNARSSGY